MTKIEAIMAMEKGKKVTHEYFSPNEWMTIGGRGYVFEDGCTCEENEFWRLRTGGGWECGWKLYA